MINSDIKCIINISVVNVKNLTKESILKSYITHYIEKKSQRIIKSIVRIPL